MIHTHQALWEAVATGLARPLLHRMPTLVQPASAGYYGERRSYAGRVVGGALKRAILANTGFAAISAEISREWQPLGVSPNRMVLMASGVDAEEFRPGPMLPSKNAFSRARVCSSRAGSIPRRTSRSCSKLGPNSRPNRPGSLILVGPGDDRQRLETLAASLGIAGRVQFTGGVDNPAEYPRAADVFVLPSVAEGMSNSLLEAMATALPCAASGIGGNTDLIEDGVTGRLVVDATPKAWTRPLAELLDKPSQSQHLGRSRVAGSTRNSPSV